MENLRSNDDTDETNPNISLLQRYAQPAPPSNNEIQYAQIIRPQPVPQPATAANEEQFDFRLQTTQQAFAADNASVTSVVSSPIGQPMSGASSISSGYIDLTSPNNNNQAQRRYNRQTSPETSF